MRPALTVEPAPVVFLDFLDFPVTSSTIFFTTFPLDMGWFPLLLLLINDFVAAAVGKTSVPKVIPKLVTLATLGFFITFLLALYTSFASGVIRLAAPFICL